MTSTATFHLFPGEHPKQLKQDEIIQTLDQAKSWVPEWHESIDMPTLTIFECLIKNMFLILSIWRT
jgi:hypothetical protein